MRTHGYVYIFLVSVITLTCQPTFAEIGSLFRKDKTLQELFSPRGPGPGWRSIDIGEKKSGYLSCLSQDWLQTQDTNTTGIREITIKVVYKNYEKQTNKFLNKTEFVLGVLNGNGDIKNHPVDGIINKKKSNMTTVKVLPINYPKMQILIRKQDGNDCMLVYDVQITYKFCTKKTFFQVAHFPKTFAPKSGSVPLAVKGSCSYGRKKPIAYCDSKGEWSFNETLPCNCAPGEVMSSVGCVELSSIIQEGRAVRLSTNRAIISWKQKAIPNIQYKVICVECRAHNCAKNCPPTVQWEEIKLDKFGENSTDITGLKGGLDYKFIVVGKIKAINEKHWNETSKDIRIKALPEEVRNLSITTQNNDKITLTWLPPNNMNRASTSYEISCQVYCHNMQCTRSCEKLKFIPSKNGLLQTNLTITGFKNQGMRYVFKVLSKHRRYESSKERLDIEWNFAEINYTDFREELPKGSKSFNVVDVVIGVSVLILAVVVTIVATRCYNRWRRRKHSLSFDSENPEHSQCEVPLTDATEHYVDPSNYDSIENVLKKFTKKLNEKNLKTEAVIGGGEFGVVWKGYLDIDGKERTVAVKCLRSGLSAKLRRDFLAEASVMGQFKDPNVISLHGVVVKKNAVKIVMEFMSNGSLDQFLLKSNARLTTLQLLGIARGIASGMNYLSGRNFIHRDLAARNILVDENLTCKVSDFGLTREICQTSNYETRGGKIPIRWTAPEVIKHRKSFIASDVWSYGVVLWEIMSFGQRPYWDWDNFRVLQEIESGYRLPAPLKCPKTVHTLMLHCWEKERADRPLFMQILEKLDEWIRSPETIHHSPAPKARRETMEPIEPQSPIHKWLDSIKMGKYASNFSEAGYNRLSQVTNLTEEDLTDMGITLVGHRHKIHQSIPLVT
ncbi:ephrin type-A receptor 4-like isoform X2 [Dendronephthya gigantea]|uniref:ephrin type-A receptor 4-like isoform X2 n=1 Tax=Dendronephthya gigantea TaxID=151771 RepID=UPI00106B6C08|nr:ephrin type-A receptor 4-like isoform X2 [Dendronephthya gigantea]